LDGANGEFARFIKLIHKENLHELISTIPKGEETG
jgi:hypothetical protein